MNGLWFSELSEETRKPLLRELGLPITKKIMYRDREMVSQVLDFKIEDVWDRWCNIVVKLADGTITSRTHSWYFSDMNSVPEKVSTATARRKKAVAQKKTVETSDDVPGLPNTYIVFDLETTGLNCTDCQIAEIGAIKVRDGNVVDEFSQLVYIDFPMPRDASNVNHITDEMLADAPHATEAMRSFIEFIGTDAVLVGQNINRYDLPLIERVASNCRLEFNYSTAIDTYQLAKRAWPGLGRWRMEDLRDLLDIRNNDAHRALADCEDEMAVYDAIRSGVKSGELSVEPPRRRASRPGAIYNKNWDNKVKAKDIKATTDEFDESHPLFGKLVVVSGDVAMFNGDRVKTWQAIANAGGTPQDNITKKTGYLVCGDGAGVTKKNKAEQYGIEIITAEEFESMFKGEE